MKNEEKMPAEKTDGEKMPAEKTDGEKMPAEKTDGEKMPAEKTDGERMSAEKTDGEKKAPVSGIGAKAPRSRLGRTDDFDTRFDKKVRSGIAAQLAGTPSGIGMREVIDKAVEGLPHRVNSERSVDGKRVKTFLVVSDSKTRAKNFGLALAKAVSKVCNGTVNAYSCVEFSEQQGEYVFAGDHPSYHDAKEGVFYSAVTKDKKSIHVFSDIEEAFEGVQQLLSEIILTGKVTNPNATVDNKKNTDCTQTILIFTTSVGGKLCGAGKSSLAGIEACRSEMLSADNDKPLDPALVDVLCEDTVLFLPPLKAADYCIAGDMALDHLGSDYRENDIYLYFSDRFRTAAVGKALSARSLEDMYELVRTHTEEAVRSVVRDSDSETSEIFFDVDCGSIRSPMAENVFRDRKIRVAAVTEKKTVGRLLGNGAEVTLYTEAEGKPEAEEKQSVGADLVIADYTTVNRDGYLTLADVPCFQNRIFRKLTAANPAAARIAVLPKESEADIHAFDALGTEGVTVRRFRFQASDTVRRYRMAAALKELFEAEQKLKYQLTRRYRDEWEHSVSVTVTEADIDPNYTCEDTKDGLVVEHPEVTFDEIIGNREAKEELRQAAQDNRDAAVSDRKMTRAFCLYGPAGTGKTSLAKAVAAAQHGCFYALSGCELKSNVSSQASKRIRRLFASARKHRHAVIFIDEIESVARDRRQTGSESSREILTALLVELDGFASQNDGVVFICATNLAEELDPAFLRRVRKIYCGLPTKDEILVYCARELSRPPFDVTNAGIVGFVRLCEGRSLAKVKQLLDLAYRIARRREGPLRVTDSDLWDAYETDMYSGGNGAADRPGDDCMAVAIHESGHAVVSEMLGHPVQYASVGSGNSPIGGFIRNGQESMSYRGLCDAIRISMGGMAAEQTALGAEGSTLGCEADLAKAKKLACLLFDNGQITDDGGLQFFVGEDRKNLLLNRFLNRLYTETLDLLQKNRGALEAVSTKLAEKRRLVQEEIRDIMTEAGVR